MRNVVQENPASTSYNVTDLETMRLSKLHEAMRQSGGEAYEAHLAMFEDLFRAQERVATIEPYWCGIVGDGHKHDAVKHLQNEAKRRLLIRQQEAAIKAAAKR